MSNGLRLLGQKIIFQKHNITVDNSSESYDTSKDEKGNLKFTALGYYDTILISDVKQLEDFRPSSDAVVENEDFRNEYVLRCIVPCDIKSSEMKVRNNKPFIAVVSIDLMDTTLRKILNEVKDNSSPNASLKIFEIVKEKLQEIKNKRKLKVNFNLYLCLGYTDMVAVVQSDGLSAINKFLSEFRTIAYGGEYLVSSSYTIYGLSRGYDGRFANDTVTFISRWAYKNIGLGYERQVPKFFKNSSDNVNIEYGIFDKSCTLNLSSKEFYEKFKVDPYKDKDIKVFSTSLIFDGAEMEANQCLAKNNTYKYDVKSALDKFIRAYRNLINKERLHKRLLNAMISIEHFYELIRVTNHSEDISEIVGEFYFNSLTSLTEVVYTIEKIKNEADKNSKIIEFENAVAQFRNSIQFLLFDVLRSDHSFFEVPSIAHPSIGGTIKILLAYNRIITEWNEQFEPNDERHGQHKMSFLVTSGGCDKIKYSNILWKIEDILPHKTQDNEPVKLPIIISIPEASLYDVEGTLFRLAHEFFHLRGERLRKGREEGGGKSIMGRYAHFYRGLLNEYIDFCYEKIIDELNSKENSKRKNKVPSCEYSDALKKTKEKVEDDFISKFANVEKMYKENDLKGKGIEGYAKFAKENLEMLIFMPFRDYTKVLIEAYNLTKRINVDGKYENIIKKYNKRFDFIENSNKNISVMKDLEFRNFAEDVQKGIKKDLSLDEIYILYVQNRIKEIEIIINNIHKKNSFINVKLRSLFEKYRSSNDENELIEGMYNELCKISDQYLILDPANAYYYAIGQTFEIPEIIAKFGYLYGKHDFERFKNKSDDLVRNFGLVYSQNATDCYNIFHNSRTKEDECLSLLPMSEYYSHLWTKATLQFFLDGKNEESAGMADDRALNSKTYSSFVQDLYRECFADVSALKLLEGMIPDSQYEKNSVDYRFAQFEKLIEAFLSEQHNISRLFGAGKDSINKGIVLRIGSVYTAYVGQIEKEDGDKRKKLADKIVKIGGGENKRKVINKIEQVMEWFNYLYDNKSYVRELVDYLKTCLAQFPETCKLPQYPTNSNARAEFLLNCWASIYQEIKNEQL